MTFLCFQVTGSGKVVYVLLRDYTTSKFAKVRFKLYYPHNRSVIPTTERCSSAPHCTRCQMWPHVVSSLGDKLGVPETTCTELVLCSTRTTSSYRQWSFMMKNKHPKSLFAHVHDFHGLQCFLRSFYNNLQFSYLAAIFMWQVIYKYLKYRHLHCLGIFTADPHNAAHIWTHNFVNIFSSSTIYNSLWNIQLGEKALNRHDSWYCFSTAVFFPFVGKWKILSFTILRKQYCFKHNVLPDISDRYRQILKLMSSSPRSLIICSSNWAPVLCCPVPNSNKDREGCLLLLGYSAICWIVQLNHVLVISLSKQTQCCWCWPKPNLLYSKLNKVN